MRKKHHVRTIMRYIPRNASWIDCLVAELRCPILSGSAVTKPCCSGSCATPGARAPSAPPPPATAPRMYLGSPALQSSARASAQQPKKQPCKLLLPGFATALPHPETIKRHQKTSKICGLVRRNAGLPAKVVTVLEQQLCLAPPLDHQIPADSRIIQEMPTRIIPHNLLFFQPHLVGS